MRAVASRVSEARVTVHGRTVGAIHEPGVLALVGVHTDDSDADAVTMARKLHELRILHDEASCASAGAPLLVISQFTLYGDTRKGRRPSWTAAARPTQAEAMLDTVVAELRERDARVSTGEFGAMMQVHSVNDGPFTVLVET